MEEASCKARWQISQCQWNFHIIFFKTICSLLWVLTLCRSVSHGTSFFFLSEVLHTQSTTLTLRRRRRKLLPEWGFKVAASWSWIQCLIHSAVKSPFVIVDSKFYACIKSSEESLNRKLSIHQKSHRTFEKLKHCCPPPLPPPPEKKRIKAISLYSRTSFPCFANVGERWRNAIISQNNFL